MRDRLGILWLLALLACRQEDPSQAATPLQKGPVVVSASFDNVKYGFDPSDCSPAFEPSDPHGIKLAVPAAFNLAARSEDGTPAPLPLCLTVRLDGVSYERFEQLFKAVKVMLIDEEHREVLTAGVWRDRHYVPRPKNNNISAAELAQRVITKYCSVNLREHVTFPERTATYTVQAVLESYKSNQATLHIEVE
jgi:hypothetical protein